MSRLLAAGWIAAGTVLSLVLLWGTVWPLGVAGEWEWPRLPLEPGGITGALLAGGAGGGYLLVVGLGGMRLLARGVSRLETAAWLLALGAASFGWLCCVQDTAPSAGALGKGPFVLFYPGASGYFTHVRYREPDARQLLSNYEGLMQQGDVLHIGTHPPGLFCFFYVLMAVVESSPELERWLHSTQPLSVHDALEVIATNSASSLQPLLPRDRAVLWLAMLLAQACAAATVWPLYLLLRGTLVRSAAYAGAALWPTVPAVAVFLPKSDAAFPALSAWLVWLALTAWRRPSHIRGLATGITVWLGLFISLAFLPVIAFVGLFVLTDAVRTIREENCPSRWPVALSAAAGFLVPIVVLWQSTGLNLFAVWWWNLHNHAGFYQQFTRTYLAWLAVNPAELSIAVGWPMAGGALWTAVQWLRCEASQERRALCRQAVLSGLTVWGLLWLSGKNSGEAARLWLLLMPGVVWLAAHFPQPEELDRPESGHASFARQLAYLALCLAVSVATVHRVAGFHVQ